MPMGACGLVASVGARIVLRHSEAGYAWWSAVRMARSGAARTDPLQYNYTMDCRAAWYTLRTKKKDEDGDRRKLAHVARSERRMMSAKFGKLTES